MGERVLLVSHKYRSPASLDEWYKSNRLGDLARLVYEHRIEVHVPQDPESCTTACSEDNSSFPSTLLSLFHEFWVIRNTSSYASIQGVLLQRLVDLRAVSSDAQDLILGEEVRRRILSEETF